MRATRAASLLVLLAVLVGCAVPFPNPDNSSGSEPDSSLAGPALFARTFKVHGGTELAALKDLNLALDGRWKFLITRIQPLVTDHRYRVVSEERIAPAAGIYAALYQGPAGTKQVYRSRDRVRVWYDGKETTDPDVLGSTALTADSFLLFALGPLSPLARGADHQLGAGYRRLSDATEAGRRYYRIYRELVPGLGRSDRDELVLWIDAQTGRTHRVHITLEGYRTTIGAHVDVTFLNFAERSGLLLPVAFNERVRGPLAIPAHRWWLTGLDINRGWKPAALDQAPWDEQALAPADPLAPAEGGESIP